MTKLDTHHGRVLRCSWPALASHHVSYLRVLLLLCAADSFAARQDGDALFVDAVEKSGIGLVQERGRNEERQRKRRETRRTYLACYV